MGKRSMENRRSKAEQRLDNQRHLAIVEKDAVRQPKSINQVSDRRPTSAQITQNAILRDVTNGNARTCYECECTNDKGFCDNYHLYAVIRGMCRVPVKEVSNGC
jgi:hypothetical protein